jgi:hypothetical protein
MTNKTRFSKFLAVSGGKFTASIIFCFLFVKGRRIHSFLQAGQQKVALASNSDLPN